MTKLFRELSASFLSIMVCLGGGCMAAFGQSQSGDGFRTTDVHVLWVSRSFGNSYNAATIVNQYPNLKRVYLPLFQFSPSLVGVTTTGKNIDNADERKAYDVFAAHGIEVFGIFAPIELEDKTEVPLEWRELSRNQAFAPKPVSNVLSIYAPDASARFTGWLKEALKSAKVDGVIVDARQPETELYSYSEATRAEFVKRYHLDPVDIDYAFARQIGRKFKYQDLAELIAQDRLTQIGKLLKDLAAVPELEGRKFEVYGSASSSSDPPNKRAKTLSDWGQWLTDNPSWRVVLGMSRLGKTDDALTVASTGIGLKSGIDLTRVTLLFVDKSSFATSGTSAVSPVPTKALLVATS